MLLSMTSPAAAVAAADHGVRASMPLDLLPNGRNPIVFGTAADSPRLRHARSLPPLIFQQQNTRCYHAARLALPNNPPDRVHTAGGRVAYREIRRNVSPHFRFPHICFLLDLLQLLLLLPLLLSRSSHGHTVRLKIHLPLRAARVPTSILPSRGFSRCCFPSFRRDTTLPAPSYAFFAIGKFRRWWYSSPPCSTFGGWRLIRAGLPLCPALDAGLHLNQLIESKALL